MTYCVFTEHVGGVVTCLNCAKSITLPIGIDHRRLTKMCQRTRTYLSDTVERVVDGQKIESEVKLLRPPCQHMGEKVFNSDGTPNLVKQKCGQNAAFLPVYKCSRWLRCSPFGTCHDANLIHPCPTCLDYEPILETNSASC